MKTKTVSPLCLLAMIILPSILLLSCISEQASTDGVVEIVNSGEQNYTDVLVELDNTDFLKQVNEIEPGKISVISNEKELPFQLIDANMDGSIDKLLVLLDVEKGQKVKVQIHENSEAAVEFEKRTQAEISIKEGGNWEFITKKNGNEQFEYQEGSFKNVKSLRVPDEHTDHSFFIRYEGPGWESDKVGYRFYLDWRNATDIFGKKTTAMSLQKVGLDGFDSYHEESDWGMDILKVGSSLGIGSIGYWNGEKAMRIADTDSITCEISQNGIIQSAIETNYYGWKDAGKSIDLESHISINAGSRLSFQQIKLSEELENICTGIVKHDDTETLFSSDSAEWSYIATFGVQSLNNDNMGMVVFYRTADLIELTEDEYSKVVVLKPENNTINYYFGATWQLDSDKIATREHFVDFLETSLYRLNNPVIINY